jgi:para-aminobenzoate synthetase component 1
LAVIPSLPDFIENPNPVPLIERLPWKGETPADVFERAARSPNGFLLESAGGGSGRYSYVGWEPFMIFKSTGDRIEIQRGDTRTEERGNPMARLKSLMDHLAVPRPDGAPPFFGGAVGFLSYDLVHFFEKLPRPAINDLNSPDLHLLFVDTLVAFDHDEKTIHLIHCPNRERFEREDRKRLYEEGLEKIAALKRRLEEGGPRRDPGRCQFGPPRSNFTREEYMTMVRACQAYIEKGDIYQANLSQRFVVEFEGDPWRLYRSLRRINPSPYAAYLDLGDMWLISGSPERLVRLEDGVVETRPIAGTRPRGDTPERDAALRRELLNDAKERAEHIMLVDLERNDLGRVCAYGSVTVDELMTIEEYSHVMHLVSNVRGRLKEGMTGFDVIQALFPGGTITGVPKVRCMEIIAELEPVCRGPYTGSIGYIGFSGDMELNIVIRTMILSKNRLYVQVGGGIVAQSDPEKEYHETLYKAEAMLAAVRAVS